MAEELNTRYVKAGYSTADEVELSRTPTTRTVFRGGIHPGGIRGDIVRQKQGSDGEFADVNEVNFRHVPADCGVTVELDTEAIAILQAKLEQMREVHARGVPRADQRFVVGTADEVVVLDDSTSAKAIRDLVSQGRTHEFWNQLRSSDADLASQLAAGQIRLERHEGIREFIDGMALHRDDESHWHSIFAAHPWMLGAAFSANVFFLADEVYVGGKRASGRQGAGGVATDFLFADESTKSFAVVDIKRPDTKLVGGQYRGERGVSLDNVTYSMSSDLSGSVVQVRNQIAVAVDHFESVLGRTEFERKINRVHPKGVLVVGDSGGLGDREMASFNHFRAGQFSLTIITFDELLRRLRVLYDFSADDDTESTS